MYFASYPFYILLALSFVCYYTVAKRYQWQMLLAASLVFYAFSGWANLVFICVTIVSTYFAARYMDDVLAAQKAYIAEHGLSGDLKRLAKKRFGKTRFTAFMLCLCLNIGILVLLKLPTFLVSNINALFSPSATGGSIFLNIAVPLGLSFYTFQTVSYLIDAYRSSKPGYAQRNIFKLALFASFFPQIIQGPISRYDDLSKTLYVEHSADVDNIVGGILRILFGFFKKLVIADRLGVAVKVLVGSPDEYRGVYVLCACFFYAITLYADFTGGIDITIGAAQVFGIKLKENFIRPYYSKTVAEYWRRWHITMGTWFRDYIFYPLSVSPRMLKLIKPCKRIFGAHIGKRMPVYIATIVTWFLTGLWHGAAWHFIVWGLLNGIVIMISEECSPLFDRFHRAFPAWQTKPWQAFMIVRTFVLMMFIRSFDIYMDVGLTVKMYASIFTDFSLPQLLSQGFAKTGLALADFLLVGVGVALLIAVGIGQGAGGRLQSVNTRVVYCFVLAALILVFGVYGYGYDANAFIYTKF